MVAGVGKGDRVSIYLPMIPELVYTMLACARIGAVHSIVVSRRRQRHVSAAIIAPSFIRSNINIA